MSDVLPDGRRSTECLFGGTPELSESLWLSEICRLETGRRLMTAGRSRGGSISVDTELARVMRDWIAAGRSESS